MRRHLALPVHGTNRTHATDQASRAIRSGAGFTLTERAVCAACRHEIQRVAQAPGHHAEHWRHL